MPAKNPVQNIVASAQNITKSFGTLRAVDSVSMHLISGEIYGLLGSNGAGKSTLAKIMCGLEKQDSGDVVYYGYKLDENYSELKKFFSVVPQDISCYYGFTVKQNIEFFALMYGLTGEELARRTNHLIEWLSLSKFTNKPANELSGGYKRLLNIACSLVNDPQIIFLDEPTVGLDPAMRHLLWDKIRELSENGKTICLTTHYLDEAQNLCDRVGVLRNGHMIAEGDPAELIQKYGGYRILILKISETLSDEHLELVKLTFEGSQVVSLGNSLVISFDQQHSLEKISTLTDYLTKNGYRIISSVVKEPELEDVFLNLTGERIK